MATSHHTASPTRDKAADESIVVDENRTLVTAYFPEGHGFVMLIQQIDGSLGTSASKVFRFPKHRPPNWEDPAAVQQILDAVGVTG